MNKKGKSTQCQQCNTNLFNGHWNKILSGYGAKVRSYKGFGMKTERLLCAKHILESIPMPGPGW